MRKKNVNTFSMAIRVLGLCHMPVGDGLNNPNTSFGTKLQIPGLKFIPYSLAFCLCIFFTLASCNSDSTGTTESIDSTAVMTDSTVTNNPTSDCETPGDEMAATSMAFTQGNILWEAFRNRFPYHIQVIGNSEIQPDRSCVLLLSEPSPGVTEQGINNVLSCYSHKLLIKQHQIGYDGWSKDVLITVAGVGMSDLESLKNKLNLYMFNTNYGAYSLPLQANYASNYSPALKKNLNYRIAPNELEAWFCGNEAVAFDDGTLPAILGKYANGETSLHYSTDRGFVAWILPQNINIANEKEMIRKFALDADLIIGAIAKNNNIAIIGRERQTSVFDLPPLRTETILQLAAANDKELAQSYERNNIMACKLSNGKDWAPIYLSDELLNTEYGSLLNITDQLLKSWSQNGETDYEHFVYRDPQRWGFEKSLGTLMNEKFNNSSLTFNWNTSGAAYEFSNADYNVIGLNRVGSLPVSYIPDEESSESNNNYKNVELFEQKGYNFFSNCDDANLIRAAQYASIYQIFKAYKISNFGTMAIKFNTFKPLEDQAKLFIEKITNLSDKEINRLVNLKIIQLTGGDSGVDQDQINEIIESIKELRESLIKLENNPSLESGVIKMLVNRNGISSLENDHITEESVRVYQEINSALNKAGFLKASFDLLNINANDLIRDYVKYNDTSPAQWIKTPSIVVSWNKDLRRSYGGHNIDAKLLKVEIDNSVRRGTVKIEDGIIKIHAEDQGRLTPEMIRKLGVEVKNGELRNLNAIEEFSFTGGPPKPPRNIKNVFGDAEIPSGQRGFIGGIHDVLEIHHPGGNSYMVAGKRVNSCEELQHILFQNVNNKKVAVEFIDFSQNGVEVRLKGVELEIEMQSGLTGKFRKLTADETLLLPNKNGGSNINRNVYIFENEPVPGINSKGNNIIGVELTAKDNSSHIFFHAEAKSKSFFSKVKEAFVKAFNFSKTNNVDFVKKTYSELLNAGLNKNDFALILSNTKDCVLCKSNIKKRAKFYKYFHKKPYSNSEDIALVQPIFNRICFQ